ncbi:hypothetical protein BT69DRAFT_1287623 [Atractiella rhizophila]|nr:hypothetical protein BT69DRAFT_1287623 [Atractiella rhizophila]
MLTRSSVKILSISSLSEPTIASISTLTHPHLLHTWERNKGEYCGCLRLGRTKQGHGAIIYYP